MNKEQEAWLDCYVESGDGRACVIEHYPNVSTENQSAKASNLKRVLQADIVNALQVRIAHDAPKMLNILKDIALNKSDNVRPSEQLKAASEWLTRAGLDSTIKIEVKEAKTHEQLLQRAKELASNMDNNLLNQVLPAHLVNALKDKDNAKEPTQH